MNELHKDFSAISQELKMLRQWVCWRKQPGENGTIKKIPLNPTTGYPASTTDKSTWASFEQALKAAQDNRLFTTEAGGIGFVFSENDNFCGVDLDDAINEAGEISEFANEILRELDSYTEKSQSGRGLHIIIRITQPLSTIGSGRKMKVGTADFECYDAGRYFIMTGKPYGEIKPIAERTEALKKIYATKFKKQPQAKTGEKFSCEITSNDSANFYYSGIDERDITAQFFKSLSDYGITPRENFIPILDGMIHRFSTIEDKPGKSSGAYYIHADGGTNWPNWGIRDFRQHDKMQKIKYEFTTDERREFKKRTSPEQIEQSRRDALAMRAEKLKRRQELEAQRQSQAIKEHEAANCVDADEHPYFVAKNIQHLISFIHTAPFYGPRIKTQKLPGDFCNVGDLLIPLTNINTGEFQTMQRIYSIPNEAGKFSKSFYPDISSTGACVQILIEDCKKYDYEHWPRFTIKSELIFITEGIATGLSLFEIREYQSPVICAMTCANFMSVAKVLSAKYPNSRIIIGADNDKAGNEAADKVISAGYADGKITPPIFGMDWNDYANY